MCVNPEHRKSETHANNRADKNGGHFRNPWEAVAVSSGVRDTCIAFMPHAHAILDGPDLYPFTGSGGQSGGAEEELTAKEAERDRTAHQGG